MKRSLELSTQRHACPSHIELQLYMLWMLQKERTTDCQLRSRDFRFAELTKATTIIISSAPTPMPFIRLEMKRRTTKKTARRVIAILVALNSPCRFSVRSTSAILKYASQTQKFPMTSKWKEEPLHIAKLQGRPPQDKLLFVLKIDFSTHLLGYARLALPVIGVWRGYQSDSIHVYRFPSSMFKRMGIELFQM